MSLIHYDARKQALVQHVKDTSFKLYNEETGAVAYEGEGIGNTAESGIAMLELANAVKGKDTVLYERLLEEARWGLNWAMRTRFGDGYRHGGLIVGIWTQNIRGDKDDMQAEARNTPSDNLIAASYCALAVPHFEETDPVFARWCRNCAIEDFRFAMDLFDTQKTDNNEAELSALATVTAMRLYRLTHETNSVGSMR